MCIDNFYSKHLLPEERNDYIQQISMNTMAQT